MAFYKWDRIFDSGVSHMGSTGIISLGRSGLLRPMENIQMPLNVELRACVPYFDGYLLIGPGLLIYTNIQGQSSENKLDLSLIDGIFMNGMVVLCTSNGKILFGKEPLVFQEYTRRLKNINRINNCDNKAVICGDNILAILWEKEPNQIQFKQLATVYKYNNAYLYDDKLFAYSDDGYLNIYFVDSNYNILPDTLCRINLSGNIIDAKIHDIYVDHNTTNDIYIICDHGTIAVIPDFNYTQETISDTDGKLFIYEAKLTANSYFKDMMKYKNEFIIVGYGEEMASCIKTKQLKESIIIHNLLNDITGAQRYMYNFACTYESKYEYDVVGLRLITCVDVPVYIEEDKKYIYYSTIDTKGHPFDIIDIPDSVVKYIDEWPNPVEVVTDNNTSMVKISVRLNSHIGG